jgi:tryptophanyl-tRNA synthetase
MIADDEKIFRDDIEFDTMEKNVQNTIAQLNSLGFLPTNTDFSINSKDNDLYRKSIINKLMNLISIDKMNKVFGKKDNIGEYFYVCEQLMPCFLYKDKQCIVIAGEDQDPFFRLAREMALKMKCKEPIILYTKSVPGLDGEKMSTSGKTAPIFINDSLKIIEDKIKKFTIVGAGTLAELFILGANLDKDVPYQIIKMFDTNQDNVRLIAKAYTKGLTEEEEIIKLKQIIGEKYIKKGDDLSEKDKTLISFELFKQTKTMLLSSGIREYLKKLIHNLVQNSQHYITNDV